MESEDRQLKSNKRVPTTSAILDDGTLAELIYDHERRQTALALYDAVAMTWTLHNDRSA